MKKTFPRAQYKTGAPRSRIGMWSDSGQSRSMYSSISTSSTLL